MTVEDAATPLIVDIATGFASLVGRTEPRWSRAYLRLRTAGAVSEAKGSYVHEAGVEIIDVLKHSDYFSSVVQSGQDLLGALGRTEGVLLLVVDPDLHYEVMFEYQNLERWRMTKLGGGTGIPEGM